MADKSLYIVGHGKSPKDNPITLRYGQFFIGFIVDAKTAEIKDCDVTAILASTRDFVRGLLVGKSLINDIEFIEGEVQQRYLASSQKAIIAACKDAAKKYNLFLERKL